MCHEIVLTFSPQPLKTVKGLIPCRPAWMWPAGGGFLCPSIRAALCFSLLTHSAVEQRRGARPRSSRARPLFASDDSPVAFLLDLCSLLGRLRCSPCRLVKTRALVLDVNVRGKPRVWAAPAPLPPRWEDSLASNASLGQPLPDAGDALIHGTGKVPTSWEWTSSWGNRTDS